MLEAEFTEDYPLPTGIVLHNKYRINQILGNGGFSIIYQCKDLSTGDTVAVKEYFPSGLAKHKREQDFFCVQPFKKNLAEFQTGYRHFLKEARILKECSDLPEIVTVYDFFEENQTAYIVMEYIDGLTLEQYIQTNGVLSAKEVSELFLPLLHSLKKVHQKGLIHRDIIPNNIILGIDNSLHLIDFGAAKIKSEAFHQQQTIILKKGYAPPEQYMALGNVGTWSDIYALCATMYYTLSGQAPSSAIDRLEQKGTISFPDFNNIPRYLTAVIERGLALQPSDRYKTLEDLIYALEHPESLENNLTIMKSVPKKNSVKSLFSQNIRRRLLIAGIIISLLGVVYAFRTLSFHTAPAPEMTVSTTTPTPTPVATLTPSPIPTTPAILKMADFTGLSPKNARKKIHALDPSMKIRIKKEYDRSRTKGHVISQSVMKGTLFNAGSLPQITLTISRGARPASQNTQTPDSTQTVKPAATKPAATPKPTKKNTNDFEMDSKRKSSSFEID